MSRRSNRKRASRQHDSKGSGQRPAQSSSGNSRHGKHDRGQRGKGEITGVFCGTRHGFGFVKIDEAFGKGLPDIFIPPRKVEGAITGDRVRVRLLKSQRGRPKGPEDMSTRGEITQIIERGFAAVVGVFRVDEHNSSISWVEPRVDGMADIQVLGLAPGLKRPEPDSLVQIKIKHFPSQGRSEIAGEILEILGKRGEPSAEEKAVIQKHQIREVFPEVVIREVQNLSNAENWNKELKHRRDLRDKLFFTIDGENARDFDDAICLERNAEGHHRLYVAIADVAHYVQLGTHLDIEARSRATSVYFPTRAIHMLPEILSAGACSLRPNEDRLALVAEIIYTSNGERLSMNFFEAIFTSQARLTYKEVEHVLLQQKFAPDEPRVSPLSRPELKVEIEKRLGEMDLLALALFQKRRERGSLDFDIPEAQFVFGAATGSTSIENIIRGRRLRANKLIEEFMVAANEAVSEFLSAKKYVIPYRIHEPPDPTKIKNFLEVTDKIPELHEVPARKLSKQKPALTGQPWQEPGYLSKILRRAVGLPQERLINQLLLTSLKLAVYHPHNKGHFGLASSFYSHFTSPIRRYPDLILHRVLKAHLRSAASPYTEPALLELCEHCSQQEQVAVAAEREIVQFYKVLFMKAHIGELFAGHIVGVTGQGFFVELAAFFVDGFVPLETLQTQDFVHMPEKQALIGKHRSFHMGDAVEVRLAQVDLDRRRITFSLIE